MSFENKLVIIVNKDADIGVAMNAVAHASLAIGAKLGAEKIHLQEYKDASDNNWPISGMPYIILRGKSGEIRKAVIAAKSEDILQTAFIKNMTGGTYIEQLERTAAATEEEHEYLAFVMYGKTDIINPITKKFSLYK